MLLVMIDLNSVNRTRICCQISCLR